MYEDGFFDVAAAYSVYASPETSEGILLSPPILDIKSHIISGTKTYPYGALSNRICHCYCLYQTVND